MVVHSPRRSIPEPVRLIVATPDVEKQLTGGGSFPSRGMEVIVNRFMTGGVLTVSQKKRPKKHRGPVPELERLEGFDEIWVFCYRRPKPGYRIAGRFLTMNVLALFRVYGKADIGNDYGPVVSEIIADWKQHFGNRTPHSGQFISGYLSGRHFDADTGYFIP